MIFWIIYLMGYLWFYRYTVGFILDEVIYYVDGLDLFMAMFLGAIINGCWPVLVTGRFAYKACMKWSPKIDYKTVFPPPQPIESRAERDARKAAEQRELMREKQRKINKAERELGMELTKW